MANERPSPPPSAPSIASEQIRSLLAMVAEDRLHPHVGLAITSILRRLDELERIVEPLCQP